MSDYTAPLADIDFALHHVADVDELAGFDYFAQVDSDAITAILSEYARFVETEVAPTYRTGDIEGATWQDGAVTTPAVFEQVYDAFAAAGWGAVAFDESFGGGGFPWVVGTAMSEMLNSANMTFGMVPLLTQGAIDAIDAHGSDEIRDLYLPRMITGEWSGTMNLTEPDAGSDVGNVRTRAARHPDGTYRITGSKIFISYGEHDLSDNIVHLVLARLPDAPPGTRGISCFVVPKFLVDADGKPGKRNDVRCVGIEHKMGINASPTCQMAYGSDGDGAVGWLLGEENSGMRTMFTMMNNARLVVGVSGLGLAERAYQKAVGYARERLQGRAVGAPAGTRSAIIEHPDVRRMLLTMRCRIEAIRALCYFDSYQIDRSRHHPDPAQRDEAAALVALLTPMCKAGGTDLAVDVASTAVQVHGGMGYVEETGVAQCYRDAKITQIYEGTNGIQAIDLVTRKIGLGDGAVFGDLVARMRTTVAELSGHGEAAEVIARRLGEAIDAAVEAARWLANATTADVDDALTGASPFLTMCVRTVSGWLLGVEALAALRLEADGRGDTAFGAAKVATARFHADDVLATVPGLVAAVTSGAAGLFVVPVESY